MDRDTPFFQPNYVLECIKFNRVLGVPDKAILANTGWDFQAYERNPQPVSFNQIEGLLGYAFQTLKMPYLGLALGHQWRLSCHGLAGISAMSQPTYQECLEATVRLCDKAFPAYSIELIDTPDYMGMRTTESFSLDPYSQFFMEMATVSFYNIFHFLLGDDVEPEYLTFDYPEPSYKKVYQRYFKCPLRFNAGENAFYISKEYANVELKLANKSAAQMAEHSFNQSLPDIDLNHLPKKLRLLLVQSLGAFPDLETAARRIGMSGRTLRRKLNSLGTNYQN
ncbi:MAG: AraC family transcriptional regulator, partial [Pseudomonadales bacterium]|nr:AraC family transcriptional regulator [Pseudomonadales bacterium]